MNDIRVPELGGVAEVCLWYVAVGDRLMPGDRLAELLMPGMTIDLVAEQAGCLHARHALPGDLVHAGDLIGQICHAEG
jgi:pyruvate/2-oxoglutarate dehydrogenase complex dihydrolipoamide acyltransferase (E2) component